jgi:hypothetical protein
MKRLSKVFFTSAAIALLLGVSAADAKPPPNPCYTCYVQYNLCLGTYGGDPFVCAEAYYACMEQRGCVFSK